MDRRNFLKKTAVGVGGLWLAMPVSRIPFLMQTPAHAADGYDGPFWVDIAADGGWDQALICDPKPSVRPIIKAQMSGIHKAGNIPHWAGAGWEFQGTFFQQFYKQMLVFNGVNTGTNNHSVGTCYNASGRLPDGSPSFIAQVAAARAAGRPMTYLSYGGYVETGGLVSPTHADDRSMLQLISSPNKSDSGGTIIHPNVRNLVKTALAARLTRMRSQQNLVSPINALDKLQLARLNQDNMANLKLTSNLPNINGADAVDTGLAAFQAGLATGMTYAIGGFDTHSDNDNLQKSSLTDLYALVTYLMTEAEKRGVPVILTITSDFGRSPNYTGNGTDHWAVSSMIVLTSSTVPAAYKIAGNRVIGASTPDPLLNSGAIAGQDLQPGRVNVSDPTLTDPNGEYLTPAHIYRYLRKKAQIDTSTALSLFPITVDKEIAIT